MGMKHYSSSSYDDYGGSILGKKSWSKYDTCTDEEQNRLPNPDPQNYNIVEWKQMWRYAVVKINYPDCTNYEGNKIMVYEDVARSELLIMDKGIDPHFSENKKYHSPIARFEPTERGWGMAISLCKVLHMKDSAQG